MKSLDPRVLRLPETGIKKNPESEAPHDQFGTFEVFVEPRPGKSFQHEGSLHAPNLELAYVLAKENYTRRFTCSSLFVVETTQVYVSAMTNGTENVYDLIEEEKTREVEGILFEVFHLAKRGKQHLHVGNVSAPSPEGALSAAKKKFDTGKIIVNIWLARTDTIRFTSATESDFWTTLPEKKFRDAIEYKGGQKLTDFLEKNSAS